MDGQNTIAARKFLNGGEDLQIRCKVYFGMTEREEALLFAQQTGISERLSAGQKLRALIFAGEPAAVAFQQATELAGVHLSFEEGRGKQRISCIATAYHEFIRLGPELYIESLDVLLNAWNGEPDSMSSANLLGICRFVELYHSEYNKGRLIAKLRQVDAFTIFRLARTAGVSLPGKTKYLQQVYTILDDDRRLNAQRFDDFFYQHQGAEPEMPHQTAQSIPENSAVDADAAAALTKLLANPSMAELIKNLAKNL